jgi:hypothetical protein
MAPAYSYPVGAPGFDGENTPKPNKNTIPGDSGNGQRTFESAPLGHTSHVTRSELHVGWLAAANPSSASVKHAAIAVFMVNAQLILQTGQKRW